MNTPTSKYIAATWRKYVSYMPHFSMYVGFVFVKGNVQNM